MICLCDISENAAVIVNPKGEMKGTHWNSLYFCMHNWNFLVANACEHIQKQSIGKECHSTVFGGDFTVTCSSFTYNSELYLSASDFDRPVFFSHQGWYEHKKKKIHQMFRHMHGVLNEVYLQNFLHRWVVNRETNLMSLLNPCFAIVMLQYHPLIID